MTVEPYIVDGDAVGEKADETGGLRRIVGRVRSALSTADDRDRLGELRADAALVSDGVRGRVLARRERASLAEYRYHGNPDAEVRPELRSHYERARDRQETAAQESMTADDALRYGMWGTLAVCELIFCVWLVGGLSGWYAAVAVLVGIGNVVGGVTLWRRLRREGQAYRDKQVAWGRGQDPDEEPDEDHSAKSLSGVFASAGVITSSDSGGRGLTLEEPVSSDDRSFIARVKLPGGVTTGHVRRKLAQLASAFDVYPPQISISSGGSERRLVLRVFSELPFTGEPVRSPLVDSPGQALTCGVPLGTDINGGAVTVDLDKGRHGLVVASSGNGKTELLRNICGATVLDAAARLTLLDGKPDGGYDDYEPHCEAVVTTADKNCLERGAAVLESVAEDVEDRLARSKRGETLGFHVVILDEFQEWTGNSASGGMSAGSPKRRIRDALDTIARRGRSALVRLVLASQDYDGRNLEDGVLTNIGWSATGYAPSDMSRQALGSLAKRFGLDTSEMFVDELQAGAAVVAGGGVHPYTTMRSYLQTPEDSSALVETARQLRAAAGTDPAGEPATDTTGEPAGSAETTLDGSTAALLRAVLEVYGSDDADAEWVPTETLMSEVAVGELGRSHDRATSMEIARVLTDAGATKRRAPEAGTNRPMSWHRATLIDAARQALGE